MYHIYLSLSLYLSLPLSLYLKGTHAHNLPWSRLALLAAFDFKVAGSIVDHYACANDAAVLLLLLLLM
jgi:hypothetical protein